MPWVTSQRDRRVREWVEEETKAKVPVAHAALAQPDSGTRPAKLAQAIPSLAGADIDQLDPRDWIEDDEAGLDEARPKLLSRALRVTDTASRCGCGSRPPKGK